MRHNLKLLILSVIVFVTAALMWWDQTHITLDGASPTMSASLGSVPDAMITLPDGRKLSLHSFSGHTVLLNFWASWCAPCKTEFPVLLQRIQHTKGTVLVAVSDDLNTADAEKFIAPYRKTYSQLFSEGRVIIGYDPTAEISGETFQVFQFPETIVINPDLTLRKKIVGVYKTGDEAR